jgi:hypothetical protein
MLRANANFSTALNFVFDVNCGSRVIACEHRRQAWSNMVFSHHPLNVCLNFLFDLSRDESTIKQLCPACLRSSIDVFSGHC